MTSISRQEASRLPISIQSIAHSDTLGIYPDGPRQSDSRTPFPLPDPGLANRLGGFSAEREQKLCGRLLGGRYQLISRLGMGAMGEVYRAIDVERQRPCAVKLVATDVSARLRAHQRFQNEAQMVSRLSHPNIIEVYEFNQDSDGTAFLVMEILEGADLQAVLSQTGRLPLLRALHILTEIGAGLHYAHALGIVHRDIKPNNIFLCRQPGGGERSQEAVKILDFGLAKMTSDSHSAAGGWLAEQHHLTQGLVVGTPAYMPPEALTGESPLVDPRSDQWGLAVIAYEMLGGQLPFDHEQPYQLCQRICTEDPLPLRILNPGLPPHVYYAIEVAMSKRREHRFASIADFTRALANQALRDASQSAIATLTPAAPALSTVQTREPSSRTPPRRESAQDLTRTVQYSVEELLLLAQQTRRPEAATPVELAQEAPTAPYQSADGQAAATASRRSASPPSQAARPSEGATPPDSFAWQSPFRRPSAPLFSDSRPSLPHRVTDPSASAAAPAADPLSFPVVASGDGRLPRLPTLIDFSLETPAPFLDDHPFATSQLLLQPLRRSPWLTLRRGLLLGSAVLGIGLLLLFGPRAPRPHTASPELPAATAPTLPTPPGRSDGSPAASPTESPRPTAAATAAADSVAPPAPSSPAVTPARPLATPPPRRLASAQTSSRLATSAHPTSASSPSRRAAKPAPTPTPDPAAPTAVELRIWDSF